MDWDDSHSGSEYESGDEDISLEDEDDRYEQEHEEEDRNTPGNAEGGGDAKGTGEGDDSDDSAGYGQAPQHPIPPRRLAAVEVLVVGEDIERLEQCFSGVVPTRHIVDPNVASLPFYLNPSSPWRRPVFSHAVKTDNVVIKIQVPKRTGRRRKKGSNGPWEGEVEMTDAPPLHISDPTIQSFDGKDHPKLLRRKLEDTVGQYQIEPVGRIGHTHRFRSLSDFYWDMEKSPFVQEFMEKVYSGDVEKMKDFQLKPGIDPGPNVDIIPPPIFTNKFLPVNYFYSQNPAMQLTSGGDVINPTLPDTIGRFITFEQPTPMSSLKDPDFTDFRALDIIEAMNQAFEERPIWTRRGLLNHIGDVCKSWHELKSFLSYVAYQFKSGPWKGAVIPYGLDPRTDPKYRQYQTLMFQMGNIKQLKQPLWHTRRRRGEVSISEYSSHGPQSHKFDGKTFYTDGKVWQFCDISDPLLRKLIDAAPVRPTCSPRSGFFHGGSLFRIKGIMKTKLTALLFNRDIRDEDFALTLRRGGDVTPPKGEARTSFPRVPLTHEEYRLINGNPRKGKHRAKGFRIPYRKRLVQENPDIDPALFESAASSSQAGDGNTDRAAGGAEGARDGAPYGEHGSGNGQGADGGGQEADDEAGGGDSDEEVHGEDDSDLDQEEENIDDDLDDGDDDYDSDDSFEGQGVGVEQEDEVMEDL